MLGSKVFPLSDGQRPTAPPHSARAHGEGHFGQTGRTGATRLDVRTTYAWGRQSVRHVHCARQRENTGGAESEAQRSTEDKCYKEILFQ